MENACKEETNNCCNSHIPCIGQCALLGMRVSMPCHICVASGELERNGTRPELGKENPVMPR